jgi:hypothetical protein
MIEQESCRQRERLPRLTVLAASKSEALRSSAGYSGTFDDTKIATHR